MNDYSWNVSCDDENVQTNVNGASRCDLTESYQQKPAASLSMFGSRLCKRTISVLSHDVTTGYKKQLFPVEKSPDEPTVLFRPGTTPETD